ncbi:MAG: alpha/beta hydrolase [Limnohabitans sp.]|nr:alpha/beta hydrolase [Limnohabitans sp.]
MYQVQTASRTGFIRLRQLNYHVREWGTPRPGQLPLFMVHGWMDVSASFQFVVDAMQQERHIIAPDWRGFGLTAVGEVDSFWYPDYLADLDALIDYFQPEGQIDLLGHSMGGNIVSMYAGVRPERVRRLINLEGFGMAASRPSQAPGRYAKWLNQIKSLRSGGIGLRSYPDTEAVAQRLIRTNQRLSPDKAQWLAQHWAKENAEGLWDILGHPAHKMVNPYLFRVKEMLAMYRNISAPVLNVEAAENNLEKWWEGKYTLDEFHERLQPIADLRSVTIADAGHMLHHDQPLDLAQHIEAFLQQP